MIDMDLMHDLSYLLEKPKNRCNSRYIKIHYPEDYSKIVSLPFDSFKEQLYNYIHNCPTHICPVCGKSTPFRYLGSGYSKYCSIKCSYKSSERTEKTKKTNLEKYGVENVSQNNDIKSKKRDTVNKNYGGFGFASLAITKKRNETLLKKYGTINISAVPSIKEKVCNTIREHFGVDHYFQSDINREHLKRSFLDKYGVSNAFQIPEVQEKVHKNFRKKFLAEHENIIDMNGGMWTIKCPHPECNKCDEKCFIIKQGMYHDRLRYGSEVCTHLLPEQSLSSTMEVQIRSILDKYNIEYQTNVRNIISPKELDIYVPSHNLAIECNGTYWHSSFKKESEYHYEKFKECQEKGIQLLTFWEDQFANKLQIIESILLSKLGIYNYMIGARSCVIREITQQESSSFIDLYHIQGFTKSKVRIGLFYKDDLVSVMTFSHRKGGQGRGEIGWVLDRYCVKSGYKISGGASRLLTYFIRKYQPKNITSFASNDISNGNLYEQLGFEKISHSISYWYIDQWMKRHHRSSFTKDAIIRKGWKDSKEGWTESEVMQENGFNKIYDSGITKYVMKPERN